MCSATSAPGLLEGLADGESGTVLVIDARRSDEHARSLRQPEVVDRIANLRVVERSCRSVGAAWIATPR